MTDQRPATAHAQRKAREPRPVRPYQPPELQEYGSLKELTRTLSILNPGDGFGASFAT